LESGNKKEKTWPLGVSYILSGALAPSSWTLGHLYLFLI
jgi:hypothetical protein